MVEITGNTDIRELKVPPHSIEAERAVLGGLLIDNDAWEKIADRVVVRDFYRKSHQYIFDAMVSLAERNESMDIVTLKTVLEAEQRFDEVGGLPYLGALVEETPTAANIRAYADIVREKAVLRELISTGTEIANNAYQTEGRTSSDLIDIAENKIFKISDARAKSTTGFLPVKDLLAKTVERIDELFHSDEPFTGLPTGFDDFDKITSGLHGGALVIVAGRPAMGKTTFSINIAENAAVKTGKAVAVFSMEMPADQLIMRMIASLGSINQKKVQTGKLEDDDWPRLTSAVSMLSETKVFIDDTPALSPTEVRARVRRLKREHDLGLVVIDYLQLMQIAGGSENRATEISEISRSLKALAKEMDVPVIALSQLNRSLEQRPNKRPMMSDLRESGAIEQDADLICFIYRDEVYNPDNPESKGLGEIIIGKNRHGPNDIVRVTFQGQYSRFVNYAMESYGDQYP